MRICGVPPGATHGQHEWQATREIVCPPRTAYEPGGSHTCAPALWVRFRPPG